MLNNILKTALRTLLRNKSHALINIVGLAIGISASLMIFMITSFHLSYDNFHKDSDRIYRLVTEERIGDEMDKDSGIPFPLRLTFKEDFPEIELMSMVDNNQVSGLINVMQDGQKIKYKEDPVKQAFVYPDYFEIFDYTFLYGEPSKVVIGKNSVVLSRSMANKYFGDYTQAMGKVLNIENYFDVTVTGIIQDPPMNSDLPFEMFISFDVGADFRIWEGNWTATSSSTQCFLKLKPNVDAAAFSNKISDYIAKHVKDDPKEITLDIQALNDVHYNQDYYNFTGLGTSKKSIYTLLSVGCLLLIAACINFVNLNTAIAVKRSKEVGVRKVLGGSRGSLFIQFIFETFFITLTAMIIALGVIELLSFKINEIIGYEIPELVFSWQLILTLFIFLMLITLTAGVYPSLVLSKFTPIKALKNSLVGHTGSVVFRQSLIVVQLCITQALIMAVVVITSQVRHFISTPIGIDSEALVEFSIPNSDLMRYSEFKAKLSQLTGVQNITFSNTGAASENTWGGVAVMDAENHDVQIKSIDDDYLQTYDIELIAGHNLSVQDSVRKYLVSKSLAKSFGFDDPRDFLGKEIEVWGAKGPVVGVVEDFSAMPLQYDQKPLAMWSQKQHFNLGTAKVNSSQMDETMASVKSLWEEQFPEYIFSYKFLDDKIANFYKAERQTANTFMLFTFVALFTGVIGLLGLMSYMVNTRLKEIGIRKVLGAKAVQIVTLLSRNFIVMVLISFAIAAPISYFFLDNWLSDYSVRISIGVQYFVITLVVCLVITQVTILFNAVKAALYNPVEILKNE
ncbi:ABC transporter permease [Fulvivirga ligni]|uniref:ABC transporter permease n=1 Tax=Fulvivirga ligni TaxID=2904246 RepID=UPI001F2B22BB|nr:ABC transporter permease [Fulvivirga ligni]UII20128.1 ABC transporter permease [Fulvivirga ligni]